MFELKPCCPDHTTPMIHNLKPCIPFDNLLDVFLFTLRQGWGSRDCTAARGLACSQCGWGSISSSGCKESQFYSLPYGQAVASMY